MSTINIRYNKPSALERLGLNATNAAFFAAQNSIITITRGNEYTRNLEGTGELTREESLRIDDGDVETNRNKLVLSSANDEYQVTFYDVALKVHQRNTIKETPLTGARGSVKEYIQAQDYEVSLEGSLINKKQGAFPWQELKALVRLMQESSFKVLNKYLEAFDIYDVVVKKVDYKQAGQDYVNRLPFAMTMISDENYELEIDE